MNLSSNRFRDAHAHASAIGDWQQTYSQISAGTLHSSLAQLRSRHLHLFREHIDQRVVQHGEAPRGKMCFAIPIAIPGSARMQGRNADETSLFVLRGGEEFMFHMPKGMDLISLTFEQSVFDKALAQIDQADQIERQLRQPVIRIPTQRITESRRRISAMFQEALADSSQVGTQDFETNLEMAMLQEMLQLLADSRLETCAAPTTSVHSFIVEKCHRLTVGDSFNPPNVMDLCKRLRVSRRTLQNSFKSVTESTPNHYIRSIRLNGVRRDLMSTPARQLPIGDAASQWGFHHLSHFAADYHGLFGELPSQTRRAADRDAAKAGYPGL